MCAWRRSWRLQWRRSWRHQWRRRWRYRWPHRWRRGWRCWCGWCQREACTDREAGGNVYPRPSALSPTDYATLLDVTRPFGHTGTQNTHFVKLCEQAGISFVGPPSKVIQRFGDKTEARALAKEFNVPIVPGTEHAVTSVAEAHTFCEEIGYPVICKAAFGGGGRGMRMCVRSTRASLVWRCQPGAHAPSALPHTVCPCIVPYACTPSTSPHALTTPPHARPLHRTFA